MAEGKAESERERESESREQKLHRRDIETFIRACVILGEICGAASAAGPSDSKALSSCFLCLLLRVLARSLFFILFSASAATAIHLYYFFSPTRPRQLVHRGEPRRAKNYGGNFPRDQEKQ